jgi:hypothetical protein
VLAIASVVVDVIIDVLVTANVCVWLTRAVSVNVFGKIEVMLEVNVTVV